LLEMLVVRAPQNTLKNMQIPKPDSDAAPMWQDNYITYFFSINEINFKNHNWINEPSDSDLAIKIQIYRKNNNFICQRCKIKIRQVHYTAIDQMYTFVKKNNYYIEANHFSEIKSHLLTCEEQIIKNIIE